MSLSLARIIVTMTESHPRSITLSPADSATGVLPQSIPAGMLATVLEAGHNSAGKHENGASKGLDCSCWPALAAK